MTTTPATPMRDPQLGLFEARPGDATVVWLENMLMQHGRWVPAAEILQWLGRENNDAGKRLLRSLANASEWILSGPGSPGYKHLAHSTKEESHHYSEAHISQGKDMIKRGLKIRRNAHRLLG